MTIDINRASVGDIVIWESGDQVWRFRITGVEDDHLKCVQVDCVGKTWTERNEMVAGLFAAIESEDQPRWLIDQYEGWWNK